MKRRDETPNRPPAARKPRGPKPAAVRRGVSTKERNRAVALCTRPIEYVWSAEFDRPDAAERILGPSPEVTAEALAVQPGELRTRRAESRSGVVAPAGTPPYLAALYEFPLLSREEEYRLFRKMNYLRHCAEQLRREIDLDCPRTSVLDQIEKHLADARSVRDEIVRCNLRLVVSIAKTVVDHANGFDELVSDGNVPLIRAVEIFDFERGTRFSTYATWAVRNSLFRSAPRNRRTWKRFVSGASTAFDSMPDGRVSQWASQSATAAHQGAVGRLMSVLTPREQSIVMARFGLDATGRAQKFREIAATLKISTERVRQLLGRALEQMQQTAQDQSIDAADLF